MWISTSSNIIVTSFTVEFEKEIREIKEVFVAYAPFNCKYFSRFFFRSFCFFSFMMFCFSRAECRVTRKKKKTHTHGGDIGDPKWTQKFECAPAPRPITPIPAVPKRRFRALDRNFRGSVSSFVVDFYAFGFRVFLFSVSHARYVGPAGKGRL